MARVDWPRYSHLVGDQDEPRDEQDPEAINRAIKRAISDRILSEQMIRDSGTEYGDLDIREITVNQVIAYNMAYFRKAAGLKQEELGERLAGWVTDGPWSKAAVSAAERSWDGKRIRQFDADLIYGLAKALMLPIGALFLPPDRDGVDYRYVIVTPHEGRPQLGVDHMGELMESLIIEAFAENDADVDDELWAAYRARMKIAATMYLSGPSTPPEIFGDQADEARLVESAARLRGHYEALRGVLAEIDGMLTQVHGRLAKTRKRLPMSVADKEFLEASRREQAAKEAKVYERQEKEVLARRAAGDSVEKIAADLGWSLMYVASVFHRAALEEESGNETS